MLSASPWRVSNEDWRTGVQDGYLNVMGKGGEDKTVPVEEAVVVAIQDWVACHDSPWVFPGKGEGHLNARTM